MAFSTTIIQGKRGLFLCSEPKPRLVRNRLGVDELGETWNADYVDALVEGQVHPLRPGMIIEQITAVEEVPAVVSGGMRRPGVYLLDVNSSGSHDGRKPTKILRRGGRRTLESGWDEQGVSYLSWHARWRACQGVASTGVIHCDAHGFQDGQRVFFARKTGGSGITAQSSSSLGVGYYVVDAAANQFKLSATLGGAVMALGTDMTAGEVIAAEFALGASHPDHATMHLCELGSADDNTDWRTVTAVYRGLEEAKPYHRMITVNGQQFSSSDPITVDLPGGWGTPLNSNFHLPEVVVTDTYTVGSGSLPTGSVPSFSTPPNAPTIASYVITAPAEQLVYNYPYGWTLVGTPQQATLNSQIQAMVYSLVYRYIWPVMFK